MGGVVFLSTAAAHGRQLSWKSLMSELYLGHQHDLLSCLVISEVQLRVKERKQLAERKQKKQVQSMRYPRLIMKIVIRRVSAELWRQSELQVIL